MFISGGSGYAIGGSDSGEGNVFANNSQDGIALASGSGTGTSILGNTFYSNGDSLNGLTHAILENHAMWNELNSFRDQLIIQQNSSAFTENIVVGTTTAVTGGLTVGYVIWLIRSGSLLATMVSVMPTWMSFDPLPVMDRFEEEKAEEDKESLTSIVTGGHEE